MTSHRALPAAYRRFLEEFNAGWYWASHETLEEAWRRSRSEFYHGLILLASAFVHVRRENLHGVAAQLEKAITALSSCHPQYLGLDVSLLIKRLRLTLSMISQDPASSARMVPRITAPVLEIEARLIRGTEPELDAE